MRKVYFILIVSFILFNCSSKNQNSQNETETSLPKTEIDKNIDSIDQVEMYEEIDTLKENELSEEENSINMDVSNELDSLSEIYINELINTSGDTNFFASRYIENYFIDFIPDTNYLVLDEKSVVIKEPSALEIIAMKRKLGSNFYTSADDNIWYLSQTKDFLNTKDIKIIDVDDLRYLNFVLSNGETIKIDMRNKVGLGWRVFLFDPNKNPVVADFVMFQESYNEYFSD